MTDRLNRRLFQTADGKILQFSRDEYLWDGTDGTFECDEDTEQPIDANGKPIKGAYLGQPS